MLLLICSHAQRRPVLMNGWESLRGRDWLTDLDFPPNCSPPHFCKSKWIYLNSRMTYINETGSDVGASLMSGSLLSCFSTQGRPLTFKQLHLFPHTPAHYGFIYSLSGLDLMMWPFLSSFIAIYNPLCLSCHYLGLKLSPSIMFLLLC